MIKQRLINTYVNNVDMNGAILSIDRMISLGKKSYVIAVNVDVIIKIERDSYLKKIIADADMVLVDGKPLIWISKLYGKLIKEKVSGSDLVPKLCELASQRGYKIFILGGKEGVAEKAKCNLEKKHPGICVVGTYSPPLGFEKDNQEIRKINSLISENSPDLLITCFGCPKQEYFIFENINKYDAKVSICAGATVDFLAGNVKRSPRWMSELGFEWLYRFFKEPKRLFKRYFIDDIKIIALIFKYWKANKNISTEDL